MTTFWICAAIAATALLAAETILRLERRRIAAEIQRRGGQVYDVTWRGFERARFQNRRGRAYDVIFDDRSGRRHRARLLLTLFAPPVWLEDAAAGLRRSDVSVKDSGRSARRARATVRVGPSPSSESRAA